MRGFQILLLMFTCVAANAQPNFEWAASFGNSQSDYGLSIAVDHHNNSYLAGQYTGTVDFDPGNGVFELTSKGSGSNMFVLKLDENGALIWVKSIEARLEYSDCMKLDSQGNVAICGVFSGTIDFDPGNGQTSLTSTGSFDVFVLKLTANGNFIWANKIEATGIVHPIMVLETGSNGEIIVGGSYYDTLDCDPSSVIHNIISNGKEDMFIVSFSPAGGFNWARSIGGIKQDGISSIVVDDSNNIIACGYFRDTVDFDPGSATLYSYSNGISDLFYMKLTSNGDLVWVNTTGSNKKDVATFVKTDASNNIYVSGWFNKTVDFDPSPSLKELTAIGDWDAFILKLNPNGELIWVHSLNGIIVSIGHDKINNVYLLGRFEYKIDLDPSSNIQEFYSIGNTSVFVCKLNKEGEYNWGYAFGGGNYIFPESIFVKEYGNIYTTGWYRGAIDADPGPDSLYLKSNGLGDIFIQKLSQDAIGIKENGSIESIDLKLILYPNPGQGNYSIDFSNQSNIQVSIFNNKGELIDSHFSSGDGIFNFNIEGSNGIYLVQVLSKNGISETIKVIKID